MPTLQDRLEAYPTLFQTEILTGQLPLNSNEVMKIFKKIVICVSLIFLVNAHEAIAQETAIQKAIQALEQGDHEAAEKHARLALNSAKPEDMAAARNLMGIILGQAGKFDEAIQWFKLNAESNPDDVGALTNWAQALRRAGRPGEAIPHLRKATELMPDATLYALQLRLARIENGEDEAVGRAAMGELERKPVPIDWLLTAAAVALHREKWEEAKILLTQARAVMTPQQMGEILQDPAFSRHADRDELADVFPQRVMQPTAGPRTMEALNAYMAGQHDEALELLKQASQEGEADGPILTIRGGILMEQGRFEDAAKALEAALQTSPGDLSLYLNYGEALRASKRHEEASKVFQQGLKLDPLHELIALKLAFTLTEMGQGAEVLESGLKDIKQGPLMMGKAAAAASLGRFAEAGEFLLIAKESMPEEAFAAMLKDPALSRHRENRELGQFFAPGDEAGGE